MVNCCNKNNLNCGSSCSKNNINMGDGYSSCSPSGSGGTGPTGPTGPAGGGSTGPTGPAGGGPTGPTGLTGPTGGGSTGPTGPAGSGPTGPTGPAGGGGTQYYTMATPLTPYTIPVAGDIKFLSLKYPTGFSIGGPGSTQIIVANAGAYKITLNMSVSINTIGSEYIFTLVRYAPSASILSTYILRPEPSFIGPFDYKPIILSNIQELNSGDGLAINCVRNSGSAVLSITNDTYFSFSINSI